MSDSPKSYESETSAASITSLAMVDNSAAQSLDEVIDEPSIAENTDTKPTLAGKATYVVNEGGSLWRTGKRFIDDEVVLDRLLDKLADKGMNVRTVSAGMAFIVEDLERAGLLVVFNDGNHKYTSHIFEGSVATLMQSQAEIDGGTASAVPTVE